MREKRLYCLLCVQMWTGSGRTRIAQTNDCDGLNFFSWYQHNIWTVLPFRKLDRSCQNIGVNERDFRWEREPVSHCMLSHTVKTCSLIHRNLYEWINSPLETCSPTLLFCSCLSQSLWYARGAHFIHSKPTASRITCTCAVPRCWKTVNVQQTCVVIGLFWTSSIRMTTNCMRERHTTVNTKEKRSKQCDEHASALAANAYCWRGIETVRLPLYPLCWYVSTDVWVLWIQIVLPNALTVRCFRRRSRRTC